ncbi:tRNA (guanosine(46)-N7)-methyltransferase TrmB [Terrilactibacillus sp. BCM23-1]|uniref:tRNA (guanine-N(7)-)-methyltransferase n=1 Tax=Terrilactibacillus tamarindi TaxID=2599694 RepID=A0A6N8CVW4_9BACI|nr:tRNA (guanosine(46)-N7)-methyltransferase TrmB [Terrilactibacillus tamarindi]MTT32536.1 tRNA (guanosine(46)-N7)-methyltransferase TrmB [Terrilactibacillus tamarindi]
MRVRHKPWAKDKLLNHPEFVVTDPKSHIGEWQSIFKSACPIHVEIGTGKGQFITNMAKQNPDINFVGIEIHESVIVSALDKCINSQLKNVRLINGDANELTDFFSENEVAAIYLNFSDPWPKNRHEKRRLTYRSFLAQYEYVLNSKGRICLKTDNQGLFEYSLESFSKYGLYLQNVSLNLHQSHYKEENVMTEYEEKFSSQGHRIYRCEACFSE